MPRFHLFALEPSQRAYLSTAHRMHTRRPVLETPHVQEPATEIKLIPSQCAQLARPEAMPVCNQNHRRVAMPVSSAIARGLHEEPDFLDS